MAPIPKVPWRNESSKVKRKSWGKKAPGKKFVTRDEVMALARKTQETKNFLLIEQSKTYVYNTIASFNITNALIQGLGANNRLGQQIHLVGLKIRAEMGTTAYAVMDFRVIVCFSTSQVAYASNLTNTDLFVGSTTNAIQGITDARKIVKLYDKTHVVANQTVGNPIGKYTEFYVKLNQDFNYLLDGNNQFGEESNLYFVVIPHTQTGGMATQPYFQFNAKLYFKDA